MKTVTILAAHAALLALCGVKLEAGKESAEVELSEELIGKINSALVAGNKASSDLTEAQNKITETEKAVSDAKAATKKAEDALAEFKTANPGAVAPKKEGDDKIEKQNEGSDFSCDFDDEVYAKRRQMYPELYKS